jgi:hypothetical protein
MTMGEVYLKQNDSVIVTYSVARTMKKFPQADPVTIATFNDLPKAKKTRQHHDSYWL